jgi:hypothetical protein
MHHDRDFAINRNGVSDIFINTPNNAAWFERYVTDWTGPRGRLGRMKFRMSEPVFPGDEMVSQRARDSAPASTTPAAAGSISTSRYPCRAGQDLVPGARGDSTATGTTTPGSGSNERWKP